MQHIHHQRYGQGYPLVLLHGFCESSAIWEPMIKHLPAGIEAIAIDLPGFGKSRLPSTDFSIADIGAQIIRLIRSIELTNPVLVGHSLGGYVGLSMLAQAPDLFSSFALFQSTAQPDTPEKKEGRNKVIDFVNKNGITEYVKNFIPSLFNLRHQDDVDMALKIGFQTQKQTFLEYTIAMRDRPSSEILLANTNVPITIVAGGKDPIIPLANLQTQAQLNGRINLEVLAEVGHMGMLEAREQSAQVLAGLVFNAKSQG